MQRLVRWRQLCDAPRIWISDRPILSDEACSGIVRQCIPLIEAQQSSDESSSSAVDYRSSPPNAEIIDSLAAHGVLDVAAEATKIPSRRGEDIQIARTRAAADAYTSGERLGVLNVHHDRHKGHEHRTFTFMVNLSTVESGGETFFPTAGASPPEELAASLQRSFESGDRFHPAGSHIAGAVEERVTAWRHARSQNTTAVGIGIQAVAGQALLFDCGDVSCWHAPCAVEGSGTKWTMTLFKSPAPMWSSMALGL